MSATTVSGGRDKAKHGLDDAALHDREKDEEKTSRRTKLYIVGGSLLTLIVLGLAIWGLYSLGTSDQSALERLRDIAVIFIVLLFALTVVLLAGIVAALVYLTFQLKDRVIPMLEEATATAKRVRGTAEFVTEEAVKPVLAVAGAYAKVRAMTRVATGRSKKPPKGTFT